MFRGLLDGEGFDAGTRGMEVMPGLEPQSGEIVIEKERASAFAGTELDIVLRAMAIDTLILTGAWTNFSVESTARYATDIGYRVIVASDGTSSISDEWQQRGDRLRADVAERDRARGRDRSRALTGRRQHDDAGARGALRGAGRPARRAGRSISPGPGPATRSCASTRSASAAPTCTSSRASGCARGRWCSATRAPAWSRRSATTCTASRSATA